MGVPYAEVIGDPVDHSKSPLIHEFWLRKLGIKGEYKAVRVTADELPAYFESRRTDRDWRGCNVTMPLKERLAPVVDWIDDQAREVGAINCVINDKGFLGGANTDVWGLLWTLGMFEAKDAVILIGTGGAARATLYHLRGINALEVHVFGRDARKAQRLLADFGLEGGGWTLGDQPDILFPMRLVNATPLGMAGGPPMPEVGLELVDRLTRDAGVLDMIYDPLETALLARARARGLVAVNGLAMLIDQAARAFELFFGAKPTDEFDDELRELLTS